ncbi:MAG TPA: class I SAM-dependent methyltransferase [Armatimonadota bacterium]|jgi:SAM-dependent methyltransferase
MSETSREWFHSFHEDHWLHDDSRGEDEAAFIADVLSLTPEDRVLDVPCGAGRIAIHLARRGCTVTGMDLTAPFLDRARERFRREGLPGAFVHSDMRAVAFAGTMDAVYNWGGSFGYFSDADNALFVRRMAAALKPGGRLLIDQPNREAVLRRFQSEGRVGDSTVRGTWNSGAQRIESTWTYEVAGQKHSDPLSMRLYTPGQLRSLIENAGMEWHAAYGHWRGETYQRGSRRLIAVARKPHVAST